MLQVHSFFSFLISTLLILLTFPPQCLSALDALCDLGPLVSGPKVAQYPIPWEIGLSLAEMDGPADLATYIFPSFPTILTHPANDESVLVIGVPTNIRRTYKNGSVAHYAGRIHTGLNNAEPNDGLFTDSSLSPTSYSMAYHAETRSVLVADVDSLRSISIDDQSMTTVAGDYYSFCTYSPDPVAPPTSGCTHGPFFLAVGKRGVKDVVYFATQIDFALVRIAPDYASIATLAGAGPAPALPGNTDGLGTAASFSHLVGIAVTGDELASTLSIYVIEWTVKALVITNAIRHINAAGLVTTLISNVQSTTGPPPSGVLTDGSSPNFYKLQGITISANGKYLYVTDSGAVRVVDPTTGATYTLFGNTTGGTADANASAVTQGMVGGALTVALTTDTGADISGWVFATSCDYFKKTNRGCLRAFACKGLLLPSSSNTPSVSSSIGATVSQTPSTASGSLPSQSPSPSLSSSPTLTTTKIGTIYSPQSSAASTSDANLIGPVVGTLFGISFVFFFLFLFRGNVIIKYLRRHHVLPDNNSVVNIRPPRRTPSRRCGSAASASNILSRQSLSFRPADRTDLPFQHTNALGNIVVASHAPAHEEVMNQEIARRDELEDPMEF